VFRCLAPRGVTDVPVVPSAAPTTSTLFTPFLRGHQVLGVERAQLAAGPDAVTRWSHEQGGLPYRSDPDDWQFRIYAQYVVGIAGGNRMAALSGADRHVYVDDILVSASRAHQTYAARDVWRHDGEVDTP
jgi:hypothetical protein